MTIDVRLWRNPDSGDERGVTLRTLRLIAVLALLWAIGLVAFAHAERANASTPCGPTTHANSAGCSLTGNLTVACSGSNVRYNYFVTSASHGMPAPGTYSRYSAATVGGSAGPYCLGIVSGYWALASSGWISKSVATGF